LGNIKVGEPSPFSGQSIKIRSLEPLSSITAQISIALVVGKDDHDVRWFRRIGGMLAVANEDIALTAMAASPYVASGLTPVTPLRLSRLVLDNVDLLTATGDDTGGGSHGSDGEWR